jgi:hypothetical protein
MVKKEKIARENTRDFIARVSKKGVVSATFLKKDGSTRKMTFRLGVKQNLKGGKNTVERLDRPYMTVYDMHKQAYRTVNLKTLKKIKANGKTYKVV